MFKECNPFIMSMAVKQAWRFKNRDLSIKTPKIYKKQNEWFLIQGLTFNKVKIINIICLN